MDNTKDAKGERWTVCQTSSGPLRQLDAEPPQIKKLQEPTSPYNCNTRGGGGHRFTTPHSSSPDKGVTKTWGRGGKLGKSTTEGKKKTVKGGRIADKEPLTDQERKISKKGGSNQPGERQTGWDQSCHLRRGAEQEEVSL